MKSYNNVTLIGRVYEKFPLRKIQSSKKLVLTIQCQQTVIKIITWNKLAEVVDEFLEKGNLVLIDGELQSVKAINSRGAEIFDSWVLANKIKFLEPKKIEVSES